MPIPTITPVAVEHPEISFDVLRFDVNVAGGHVSLRMWRCRVLPGDAWQDEPGQRPVIVRDPDELVAMLPTIDAAAMQFMGTSSTPYMLNIVSRIAANGQLTASVNVYRPSAGVAKQIPDVYQSTDPLVGQVMPQLLAAVASLNARLQLL